MNKRFLIAILASSLGAALIGGCTQEGRDKYSDASATASDASKKTGDAIATDASESSKAVAEGAEKTGAAIQNGAVVAGQAVKNTAENAGKAVNNVDMTASVKSALLAAKGLKTNNLNVDTKDKQVILRGSVPTEDQKKQAEEIAKGIAGSEYKITDQLTVDASSN